MELFPFDKIREVQSKMISDVKKALEEGKHLIAHAPTGLGKTAASVSPSLSYVLENGGTIIFLTPKHTQHQIVIETLKKIKEKHKVKINVTDFIGKRWMCLVPGIQALSTRDFSEYCKEAKLEERCPFYNNVWKKTKLTQEAKNVVGELKEKSPLHVEEVISMCAKKEMCPYEISCLLAKDSNFIIADYYHIFHPHVRNAFLIKTNKRLSDSIIIVDEAQNLPNRIREVLSSRMSNFSLNSAIKEARRFNYIDIANNISYLLDILNELAKDLLKEKEEAYISRDELIELISKVIGDYEEFVGDLLLIGEQIRTENKRSFVGSIGSFLQDWLTEEEGYTRIVRRSVFRDKEKIEIILRCLDPGISSKELFEECHSAILMSGTLTPTRMYRDLLKMEKERTICAEYPNPFPKKNKLTLIVPETTTKFTRRKKEEFEKIADWCAKIANAIPGNVALFFPSYKLRDEVLKHFERKSTKSIFLERQGMSKKERMDLLNQFKEYSSIGAVFLGIVSGSFGEGVDLPGKFLNGVVIVGVPLDTPDLETQALIDYYDKLFGAGWNYGYIYPAMNRAIQACGRVIRSENDRGVVVLLDERFVWKNYFKLLPLDWKITVTKEPVRRIKEFFKH
ncbi:MAG: ATP-dependent DNA helicase [Nanoarchaeota archaeon]|nr:ATP-dependent DNA helicase [Nanoarchaeota archaeon]